MDFTRYFDRNPLVATAFGPSGSGIRQPQPFEVEWTGRFANGTVNLTGGSGHYAFSQVGDAYTKDFSFVFDSGSNPWLACGQEGWIQLKYQNTTYQFSGNSPILFNNSILKTGVNDTFCFYHKNTTDIFFKTSADSFATERVMHSASIQVKKLHNAKKLSEFYFRYGLFFSDIAGNGHYLLSDRFNSMSYENFNDFESEPTGVVQFLAGWMVEGNFPSGHFVTDGPIIGDGFETTPTGDINSLTSGNNMLDGLFI